MAGTWQNITNTVTASSSLYVSGGMLSVRGSSMTVTGGIRTSAAAGTLSVNNDVLISGGDLTTSGSGSITGVSTPTITLNGAGTLGGSATTTLPMILTLGNAGTTTLGGPVVLAGSTTITARHTLDVSGGQLSDHGIQLVRQQWNVHPRRPERWSSTARRRSPGAHPSIISIPPLRASP